MIRAYNGCVYQKGSSGRSVEKIHQNDTVRCDDMAAWRRPQLLQLWAPTLLVLCRAVLRFAALSCA